MCGPALQNAQKQSQQQAADVEFEKPPEGSIPLFPSPSTDRAAAEDLTTELPRPPASPSALIADEKGAVSLSGGASDTSSALSAAAATSVHSGGLPPLYRARSVAGDTIVSPIKSLRPISVAAGHAVDGVSVAGSNQGSELASELGASAARSTGQPANTTEEVLSQTHKRQPAQREAPSVPTASSGAASTGDGNRSMMVSSETNGLEEAPPGQNDTPAGGSDHFDGHSSASRRQTSAEHRRWGPEEGLRRLYLQVPSAGLFGTCQHPVEQPACWHAHQSWSQEGDLATPHECCCGAAGWLVSLLISSPMVVSTLVVSVVQRRGCAAVPGGLDGHCRRHRARRAERRKRCCRRCPRPQRRPGRQVVAMIDCFDSATRHFPIERHYHQAPSFPTAWTASGRASAAAWCDLT